MFGTEWIYKLNDQFTAPLAGINRALAVTDNAALKTETSISHIGKSSTGLSSTFKTIAGYAAGAFATIGLAEVGRNIFEIGSEMEQINMSYRTLLGGNIALSNQLVGSLKEFGKNTKFSNMEVLTAGQGLLAFGVNAGKIMPTMQTLGDLSMGNSSKFQSLVDNYGKMVSAQRGNTMDLNQFALAGVPIWKELEKITGLSGQALRKYVEQNGVGIDMIDKAFANLTGEGGMFFQMLQNSSNTTIAKLGNVMAGFEELAEKIFNRLKPAINTVLDFGISVLPTVENALRGAYNAIEPFVSFIWDMRDVIIAIGVVYIGWQTGLMLTSFWQSVQYMWMMRTVVAESLLATVTTIMTVAQQGLNAALMANPIGLVIGLLAAAAFTIYQLWQHSETFRATLYGLWEAAKVVGSNLLTIFKAVGKVILGALTFDPDMLLSGITEISNVGLEMGKALAIGKQKGIESFKAAKGDKEQTTVESMVQGGEPSKTNTATNTATSTASSSSSGGSGSSRTINTVIQRLGDVTINVNGSSLDDIRKHMPEIRKMVYETMIAGVRDFEVAISNGG